MDDWVAAVTGAERAVPEARLQPLWSGYGVILRYRLEPTGSAVVKVVDPPPGGDRSHRRKLRSYEVEEAWYQGLAERCGPACRVPRCFGARSDGARRWLALEDLDVVGFSGRTRTPTDGRLRACLDWLAAFHATFLGRRPEGLWPTGTYWHLATRPDELEAMGDQALRDAAPELDRRLEAARFQTLVHGDAKLANFCFAIDGRVAAVDFQYVGGGVGVRDVAYLLAGVSDEAALGRWLDHYFDRLRRRLGPDVDAEALEVEWRALYPVAWADFHRFLAGWAPQRPIHGLGRRLTRSVLASL